jgi:hypothetical protein
MRSLDRDQLLAMIGGLALLPANAVQQLPLEALAHVVASVERAPGDRSPTLQDLRKVATRGGGRLIPAAPDPAEQPAAAPLILGGTRATVPLGLLTGSDYAARRLFEVLDELRTIDSAVESLAERIEAVLRVVGAISERAGLDGVVAPGPYRDTVTIPGQALLAALSETAVTSTAT